MKMLEPDFWRGRGRYSKRATSRKVKNDSPCVSQIPAEQEGGREIFKKS